MTLTFALSNNVLTVIDTTTNNSYLFSGACAVQMDYQSSTAARYTIYNSGVSFAFNKSDITTIAGSAANANPATALTQLKAVMPLYA